MISKNFNIKLEKDIKERSELIYKELGIDLSTAINIFLRKSILALLESEKITQDKI